MDPPCLPSRAPLPTTVRPARSIATAPTGPAPQPPLPNSSAAADNKGAHVPTLKGARHRGGDLTLPPREVTSMPTLPRGEKSPRASLFSCEKENTLSPLLPIMMCGYSSSSLRRSSSSPDPTTPATRPTVIDFRFKLLHPWRRPCSLAGLPTVWIRRRSPVVLTTSITGSATSPASPLEPKGTNLLPTPKCPNLFFISYTSN